MNAETDVNRELEKLLSKLTHYQLDQLDKRMQRMINRKEAHRRRTDQFFQFVKSGNFKAVKNFLLDYPDYDVNVTDDTLGNTPLIYAVLLGHSKIVSLLIEHDADPRIGNKAGADCFDALEMPSKKDEIDDILNDLSG